MPPMEYLRPEGTILDVHAVENVYAEDVLEYLSRRLNVRAMPSRVGRAFHREPACCRPARME